MGRVFRPTYTRPREDGRPGRETVRVKAWYVEYTDAGGTRRRVKIGDKRAAESALARLQEQASRERAGLSAAPPDAARPLAALIDEYLDVLAARDTSAEYRANVADQLARICPGCRWFTAIDIRPDDLTRFLGRRRESHDNGPATLNGYLQTAKSFSRWVFDQLGRPSPLRGLKPFPEEVDRRRSKRILTDDELGALIRAAALARPRGQRPAFPGADRAVLYRVAAYTGLRAGELATLTPASFSLDAAPPAVTVEARDAKGKREEPVPLPAHLVEVLRPWLAAKPAGARLWPGTWAEKRNQGTWMKRDLNRAGVAEFDAKGRRATFHGLKRRYVTRLIESGANIDEVRRLARHRDVRTTLNYYTDTDLPRLGAAVDRLPPPGEAT